MKRSVELIYFNAGGGHRTAALALEAALATTAPHLCVRRTNVMDVLDPDESFKRFTGLAPEDFYNKRLASGFTAGLSQELKVFQALIPLAQGSLVRVLQQHWLRNEPDLVVSLIPNLNRPLCASLQSALPGVPFLTVLTDLADHPPDFWIVPDLPQHLVCGTDRAVEQARQLGCDARRVYRVSGMILRPGFYAGAPPDRSAALRELGLDPTRPTGIVLFGGHGSRAMLPVADTLKDVQLILLCGHNKALARRLHALAGRAPRAVVGFTQDVQSYMRLADFFIGKPGPGSISEAIHCGLPVVTVLNAWTMPQERFNPLWVTDNGLGIVATSFKALAEPVDRLLRNLPAFSSRVRSLPPNRAVYEVAHRIAGLLEGEDAPHQPSATWRWPRG